MVLEILNRGIEKLRRWYLAFLYLFSTAAKEVVRAYYRKTRAPSGMEVAATAATEAATSGASLGFVPLRDTKLSFYDDYHVMSGIPVFILDPYKIRSPEKEPSKLVDNPENLDLTRKISFFDDPDSVTACNFSLDDSRVASGYNDGSVRIWSTEHGTVLHTFEEMHKLSPVADIRFLQDSNTVVVSTDFHGQYIVWDTALTDHVVTFRSCRSAWEVDLFLSPTICWPFFSDDGTRLVYPVIHYHDPTGNNQFFESCCSLCIFTVQTKDSAADPSSGDPDLQYADRMLDIHSKKRLDYAWSGFSHSKRSFLAGFHSSPEGFSILWTDINNVEAHAVELDGILGCWSQDDDYIATWDVVTKSAICNEAGLCYIWKVADLENREIGGSKTAIRIDRYKQTTAGRIVLSDPQGGSVFWAEFIPKLHGSLGIATCVIKDTLEVLLWQVHSQTIQHRLVTGVSAMETILTDLQAWDNRWVHIRLAYGLKPLSISADGHLLGIYSSSAQRGVLWDSYNGTEILNFSIPRDFVDEMLWGKMQMDMLFSKSGGKFLLCAQNAILVWNVPSLGPEKNRKGVNRVALKCRDKSITSGQVTCKFSQNGATIGLCRNYSLMMNIWNLNKGWEKTLAVEEGEYDPEHWDSYEAYKEMSSIAPDGNGRRFCLLAFSKDGSRVATCMGDMKVLLWDLGDANDTVTQPKKIAELRSNYLPAWDMCFTSGPNGKEILVICEDIGVLLWIDVGARKVEERQYGYGNRRARFSQDGTRAVLMPSNDVAHVWDLVKRVQIRTVVFKVWMGRTGPVPFPQNISMDGQFAVVGVGEGETPLDHGLVKCASGTTAEDLQTVDTVPNCVEMMERREWVVLDFDITRSPSLSATQPNSSSALAASAFKSSSFRMPSAAQMHQMWGKSGSTLSSDHTRKHSQVGASGSLSVGSRSLSESLKRDISPPKPNGYPSGQAKREYVAFASSNKLEMSPFQEFPPQTESLWKRQDGTKVKMNLGHDISQSKFPDLTTCFADTSWMYLLEYDEHMYQQTNTLYVVNVDGDASTKVLEAPGLLPRKFIATSADGCRVACLSSSNHLIIWTALATQNALPDWNDMMVLGTISDPGATKSLLEMHGPAIINFPDCHDMTIPFHAILAKDHKTLEALVKWTVDNHMRMALTTCIVDKTVGTTKKYTTAVDLAVAKRSPECVEMLLANIPRGLGTPVDTAFIYQQSLSKLCKFFPHVFNRILANDALLVSMPEIQVPETIFHKSQFKVLTSNIMLPDQKYLQSMWTEAVKESEQRKTHLMHNYGHQAKMITAVPKVVLYPGIAQVGRQGLLGRLVVLPRSDNIYSSFLMKALIHSKWRTYGRRCLMEEIWSFALLWVTFAGYALILGSTWHLATFREIFEPVNGYKARLDVIAFLLLLAAWLLGCMALIREGIRILNLWSEDGFSGLWYWCKHMSNWVIVTSYIFLVVFIGPLHFYIGITGNVAHDEAQKGQKRLTVLVAMESILLSWKIQSFAQAFRATAAIVIMIREIIKGIFSFLLISFLLLTGFALGFFVLFRVELQSQLPPDIDTVEYERYNDFRQRFGNIFLSMTTAFTMMLGETQMEIFGELTGVIRVVGTVMCIFYLLAMMVILLNLLIAVMGDCFERVKNNEGIQFLKGRTRVIVELEAMMSKKSMEGLRKQIGDYLHILVPKATDESSGTWRGRLIEQNELFKQELEKAVQQLTAEVRASQKGQSNAPSPISLKEVEPLHPSDSQM